MESNDLGKKESKSSVLVVEDEDILRLTFEQFLIEENYEVYTASNYNDAKTILKAHTVDVVISDIILGGKTGISLLKYISEIGTDTHVIMITGDPNVETASEAVRLGAFDYLAKPVTGNDLVRVVRLAVRQKNLKEERDQYAASLESYRRDLEAIFNGVNAGIIMVDHELKVRQMNGFAKNILNLKIDSLGETLPLLFPEGFAGVTQAIQTTVTTQNETNGVRVEYGKNMGDSKVLDITVSPIKEIESGKNGAVVILRDITRLTRLEEQVLEGEGFLDVIGKSGQMKSIYQLITDLSETTSTVLINGESGTGKEVIASALHMSSNRSKKPFIKVNCAALSEDILESELFGHVKGAFTGAVQDRVGRFEAADGGSILLDEIGDISPRLQLRLLRVLQSGEFERVGDSKPRKVDVRVIAATNQDLQSKIQQGEFRQDLYYRLNVIRIEVPPLRERKEDIPLLIEYFCRKFDISMKKEIEGVAPDAMDKMMGYYWPGNVRELENCMERAFIVCHGTYIDVSHLPDELSNDRVSSPQSKSPPVHYKEIVVDKSTILDILRKTDWNVAKSARALGMARNTLYQKMKTMEIQRPV
jgi:PAS domain S-box-containing protein